MSGCGNCCGNCGGCGELVLSEGEIALLQQLAQFPFLPVARRADSMEPIYLEDDQYTPEEYSLFLQCLEKRGLIDIDFSKPLGGFSSPAYDAYPIQGSFALTARGQAVLEQIQLQGLGE